MAHALLARQLADRYEAALAAQVSLMTQSRNALERLAKDHGMEAYLRREGQLQLYEGEAQFEASQSDGGSASATASASVSSKAPARLPRSSPHRAALHPCRLHAGLVECHRSKCWVEELAARFRAAGGRIEIATVQAVRPAEGGVWIEGSRIDGIYDRAVIAGGACRKR